MFPIKNVDFIKPFKFNRSFSVNNLMKVSN